MLAQLQGIILLNTTLSRHSLVHGYGSDSDHAARFSSRAILTSPSILSYNSRATFNVRTSLARVRPELRETLEVFLGLQRHQLPACHPSRDDPDLPAALNHLGVLVLPAPLDPLEVLEGLQRHQRHQRHQLPARRPPQYGPFLPVVLDLLGVPVLPAPLDLLGVLVLPALLGPLWVLAPQKALLVPQVPEHHYRLATRQLQTSLGVLGGLWDHDNSI
ncbi:unnamed protein product [Clonostachys solani]|uniref:Uncharacterized protein n=1 Tax=Clonostachys solani TaxID=160281 RepID=A0A9N9Z8N1_9HYPO|nr:unnamed protein product [Clonostachys solani]